MPQFIGTFTQYRPTEAEMPEWAKGSVMERRIVFARNEDGEDWYSVVKALPKGMTMVSLWAGTNSVASVTDDYEDWPVPSGQSIYLLAADEPKPEEAGWWSPTGEAPPPPAPPELSPRQFEWLLAFSGLEDLWGAVRDAAKQSGNMELYADLRAQERAGGYVLAETLDFKNRPEVQHILGQLSPDADFSDERVTELWHQAATQTFTAAG